MSDVDIGREAVERRAKAIELSWHDDARLFRALRAALDAAEAERDRLRDALKDIADERGMCAVCGMKENMTPGERGIGCCARDDECRWVLPEPVAVARAALIEQADGN